MSFCALVLTGEPGMDSLDALLDRYDANTEDEEYLEFVAEQGSYPYKRDYLEDDEMLAKYDSLEDFVEQECGGGLVYDRESDMVGYMVNRNAKFRRYRIGGAGNGLLKLRPGCKPADFDPGNAQMRGRCNCARLGDVEIAVNDDGFPVIRAIVGSDGEWHEWSDVPYTLSKQDVESRQKYSEKAKEFLSTQNQDLYVSVVDMWR